MKRAMAAVGVAVFASGCAAMKIRDEASTVLSCSKEKIKVEQKRSDTWLAEGCGRAAICQLPEGAEVQCVGGGATPTKEQLPVP
jgi:hypothetical protein